MNPFPIRILSARLLILCGAACLSAACSRPEKSSPAPPPQPSPQPSAPAVITAKEVPAPTPVEVKLGEAPHFPEKSK